MPLKQTSFGGGRSVFLGFIFLFFRFITGVIPSAGGLLATAILSESKASRTKTARMVNFIGLTMICVVNGMIDAQGLRFCFWMIV